MTRTLAVALLALVVLAGCSATPDAERATVGTPVAADSPTPPPADAGVAVTVTRVVDGDTVEIEYENGTEDTVRLLGVDTPEVRAENDPAEFAGVPDTAAGADCLHRYGELASEFVTDELDGEQVRLVLDERADRRGGYGRLLAYLYHDGDNVNYALLTRGLARVYDSPFTLRDRFFDAESAAMGADAGLWGDCATEGSLAVEAGR